MNKVTVFDWFGLIKSWIWSWLGLKTNIELVSGRATVCVCDLYNGVFISLLWVTWLFTVCQVTTWSNLWLPVAISKCVWSGGTCKLSARGWCSEMPGNCGWRDQISESTFTLVFLFYSSSFFLFSLMFLLVAFLKSLFTFS